ncbi:class I SAM-dependent methyltransferase [Pseudooceanicola sediminis]|uniref:Class I SAM-dependent methyltransferase n=1 Tax=Pseudooceanicola sediminis TaxID=2211117 RepID=A0A399IZB0_9RHOB|nr:cyclopropane-fatty-acyl-phospholipid synthase family protein [Pseudooceanicola sediminis]KAA2313427.1 class I SAM-dependent methyltransferase [Puniceibacterium sp. HSS470]RII38294.1 class I SAM-dependent methyltransferase [Pseudooceanicola sediminis]|tara:strand:+ start:9211 stop:10368 length:1158 start_codon:yes stop_codon:yes gene_type:complete
MPILTNRLKSEFLKSCEVIETGRLTLRTPEGEVHHFGSSGVEAEMQINDWSAISAALARGDVGLGEAYIDGLWDTPSIEALTVLALKNLDQFRRYAYASPWQSLKFRTIDRLLRANSRSGSSRNIRAHYDVGNEFFQLWLDPSMTYSSALFSPGDMDLGRGQMRKYDRILDRVGDGERLLEIGCGWGGFAERAARQGRYVTGLTISPAQKGYADARLDGQADIQLRDYRDSAGKYDGIVSIEMIEAVGERYWPTFFATMKARLSDSGRAVVQAITVPDRYFPTYRSSSDFIRQHSFPGGMLLSDGQIRRAAEGAGLRVTDTFAFGHDYARTCRTWLARMDAEAGRIERLGYGPAFLRSWRYYLEICAASFAVGQTDVVQVELRHA